MARTGEPWLCHSMGLSIREKGNYSKRFNTPPDSTAVKNDHERKEMRDENLIRSPRAGEREAVHHGPSAGIRSFVPGRRGTGCRQHGQRKRGTDIGKLAAGLHGPGVPDPAAMRWRHRHAARNHAVHLHFRWELQPDQCAAERHHRASNRAERQRVPLLHGVQR